MSHLKIGVCMMYVGARMHTNLILYLMPTMKGKQERGGVEQ
jgi:hypothetical protein